MAKHIFTNFQNHTLNKYIIKKMDVSILGESLCIHIIHVVRTKTNKHIFRLIHNRNNNDLNEAQIHQTMCTLCTAMSSLLFCG